MLAIYIGCLVFGGIIVGASAMAGHSGHDHGPGSEADLDGGGDDHHNGHGDHTGHAKAEGLAPAGAVIATLASVRFWSFFAAAFGLSGTLLTLLSMNRELTLAFSLVLGAGLGAAVSNALRVLSRDTVSAEMSTQSLAGREAVVVIAITPGKPGKIRLSHQGQITELLATTSERRIERQEQVLVVQVSQGVAEVTPLAPTPPQNQQQAQLER